MPFLICGERREGQVGRQQVTTCLLHRVGRVLSFFSSRRKWDSPNPLPAGECAHPPPPRGSGGRGTLAGERGVGRVPIPTRGHKLWYSLYIYVNCGLLLFILLTPFSHHLSSQRVLSSERYKGASLAACSPTMNQHSA